MEWLIRLQKVRQLFKDLSRRSSQWCLTERAAVAKRLVSQSVKKCQHRQPKMRLLTGGERTVGEEEYHERLKAKINVP
jgi:hypothetical protein